MNPHFFTAPFYFAFIWFKVQGSRGGFAAIICGAMPDQESFSPLPLEGADERSEAGLASANVGVPFHAARIVIGLLIGKSFFPAAPNPPLPFPLQRAYNIITDQWSKMYFKERETL